VEHDALLVPSEAVMTGQDGQFVFVVDDSSKAAMHAVKVARAVGRFLLIESGLEVGSRVVIDGQGKLAPGSRVQVKDAGAVAAARGVTP
jgi:multidrug efflux system membrane fusion protein